MIKQLIKIIRYYLHKKQYYFLSDYIKEKSYLKYEYLLKLFIKYYKRTPDHNEKWRIVINTSHIIEQRKGYKGHWKRQKIRIYLLKKYNIEKYYIMT